LEMHSLLEASKGQSDNRSCRNCQSMAASQDEATKNKLQGSVCARAEDKK